MRILNGWKEIAECLHRTSRSARRWERLGLPVRRITESSRSPVVAFPDEIENWVRRTERGGCASLGPSTTGFRATQRKSIDLNPNAHELQERLERMSKLCEENRRLIADVRLAGQNLSKGIALSFAEEKRTRRIGRTDDSLVRVVETRR